MAASSVLVLPSLAEGFGRVLIEAMATGTVVIGSKVGGIPEIIQEGENGFLVPADDAPALAAKLHWVLSHPQEALKMGQAGKSYARKAFSPEAYLASYSEVFEASERRA